MADPSITDTDALQDDFEDDGDEGEQTLVTKEGLKKLKDELRELKTDRRQEVAQRLKEAISYGDLSENSEYEEAKNEQAFVEGRILELERMIKSARIITAKKESGRSIDIGSTETDPIEHKISNESPIGKAFLGHHKGETVDIMTPGGAVRYEILKVA